MVKINLLPWREEKRRKKEKGRVGNCWWANWHTYYYDAKMNLSILVKIAEEDGIEIEDKYK